MLLVQAYSIQFNSIQFILKCTMPHGGTRTRCGPMKHYIHITNIKNLLRNR